MQNRSLSAAALSALLALGLWSADTRGQAAAPSSPVPSSTACAPAPAAGQQSHAAGPEARAQQVAALYQRFECHFARKEYAACLPYLEQACGLTDSPRCLLNLGAVHHALMHCQRARSYYRQYLDRVPYDEDGEAARTALEELERACPMGAVSAEVGSPEAASAVASEGVSPQPSAPAALALEAPSDVSIQRAPRAAAAIEMLAPGPPDPTALPKPLRLEQPAAERRQSHALAWSLLGAGAASLTVTVVAATYGARAERDFEVRYRNNGQRPRAEDTELEAIDARGHRYNRLALLFGVLSGVLAGAGTTLWLVELAPGATLDVSGQGAATLGYAGRF